MVDPEHYTYSVETDYKSVRDNTELHWTTEPPKVAGWYWAIEALRPKKAITVYVRNLGDIDGQPLFRADTTISDESYVLDEFTHWLGPLPTPEPPQ